MITERKAANALGGKTARACDSCLRKRARWFCAADDAFLCQGCDSSVHSANQLASRHQRVRLETASFKTNESATVANSVPAWHHGFTRKARTPRPAKPAPVQLVKDKEEITNPLLLVPDDENSFDESEEQLLYRVPVFDPFAAELCSVKNEIDIAHADERAQTYACNGLNVLLTDEACDLDLPGVFPSDLELAEFAADVESLLGTGFDDELCCVEGMGVIDCKEEGKDVCLEGKGTVKVEDEEQEDVMACHLDPAFDMEREGLDWSFGNDLSVRMEEEMEEKVVVTETMVMNDKGKAQVRGEMFLRLNYEEVITAWDSKGCPWITGTRPEFDLINDSWLHFIGKCSDVHQTYGSIGGRMGGDGGGREARVSRYREKKRSRLFSKKIRYEVRKLNAEKRPRMKGRFVKRASLPGLAFSYVMN